MREAHEAPEYLAAPLLMSYLLILSRGALAHGRQFAERVVMQERAERAAQHDPLTGLANRAAFEEELAAALGRLKRNGERFALMLLDLDDFKAVNDVLGHQAGDQLLRQVAGRLAGASRASEMVARLGGDEFIFLLRSVGDGDEIARRADSMSQCFEAPFALDGLPSRSFASIGTAQAPLDGDNAEALVGAADTALYRAKRRRKSSTLSYSRAEDRQALERRALAQDLAGSVVRGEFFLEYQPIHSLATGRLEACEALVRWRHPALGLISPGRFISIAEDTGAIHEIGEWIMREACAEAVRWPKSVAVAVNVSAHQICDRSIVRVIERALQDTGLPVERLHVEITESAMLCETQSLAELVSGLASLGAMIMLDDFGTGFSSFEHIRRLPISGLKIDRTFVQSAPTERKSATIIRSVAGMAKALNVAVVAKGIEVDNQLESVKRAGCDYGQGYLFSPPLTAPKILRLIESGEGPARAVA